MGIGIKNRLTALISFVFLLTTFVPLLFWQRLAEARVPVHFNFAGEPDGWGSGYTIFLLPLLSLGICLLLYFSTRNPRLINYPVHLSKDEKIKLFPIAVQFIRWISVVVMMLLSYLSNGPLMVGLGHWSKLPVLPLYIFTVLILLVTVAFYWKITVLSKRMKRNSK